MKRSPGVTVIAILSLLGSLFVFLLGAFVALVPFLVSRFNSGASSHPPARSQQVMLVAALVYILPALWGIVTSIELLQLKEWARISMIIFSVLLILMSVMSGLMFLVMPIPPTPNQADAAKVTMILRVFMVSISSAMAGIGVWWLIFFTRARVKQQFLKLPAAAYGAGALAYLDSTVAAVAPGTSTRPVSLTILAWLLLASCLFIPLNLWFHAPAIFLTKLLTGWPATLYMVVVAALNLYIGIGLLRLKIMARKVAVAYYVFFFLNTALFYLAPGGRSRMTEMLQRSHSMFAGMKAQAADNQFLTQFNTTPFLMVVSVCSLIGILLPLYFLITRQQAFEQAAAAAEGNTALRP